MKKQEKKDTTSSQDTKPHGAPISSSNAPTPRTQPLSSRTPAAPTTITMAATTAVSCAANTDSTTAPKTKPQRHPVSNSSSSSSLAGHSNPPTATPIGSKTPASCSSSSSLPSNSSSVTSSGPRSGIDTTGSNAATMGMKHSKSDHSNLGRKDKPTKEKKAPMGKKFISKSSENLTNGKKSNNKQQQQQQITMVVESSSKPKPSSSSTAAKAESASERNKENQALKEREKNTGSDSAFFAKPKPVKSSSSKNGGMGVASNLRKASSTQSIDKSSQGGSLGNGSLKSSSSTKSFNNVAIKRAQSTQNISKDKFTKKRTSAPADVMAYNAELLANFEKEKKLLEFRISDLTKVAEGRKVEIEKYKYEVKRLKTQISAGALEKEQLEALKSQNKQLGDRLQELGIPAEPVTDTEKLLLKFSSSSTTFKNNQGGSSSDICLLPTSASCDSLSTEGGGCKDIHRSNSISTSEPGMMLEDYCGTPDHPSILSLDNASVQWEKQSNKSANSDGGNSEVSVACLTERILQMEETNYSTAEELQATLQELGDLQDAVNELTDENGRLVDEKTVLLESLCTQTEKLEKTRIQLEQLKCLLISGELPDKSEMDGHLRGLLKSAQEEREELMRKQTEWSNALEGLEMECKETQEAGEALRDKYSLLEATNKSLKADLDESDSQLTKTREELEAEKIEVVTLKTLLESERKKVLDLETARMAQDKTDVETLLDAARRDKAEVEGKLADAVEKVARSQCEVTRVKDILSSKDQELIVLRNNSYEERGKLQYELEEGKKETLALVTEIETLRSHVVELEEDCDRLGVEKKSLGNKFQELQTELKNTMQHNLVLEAEMQEMRCKHDTESEEWNQFQKDLQTAVVIANNFSQETKKSMETLTDEKTLLQDQVNALHNEIERLKEEVKTARQSVMEDSPSRKYPIMSNAELKGKVGKVLNSMDRDISSLRDRGRCASTSSQLDQRSQSISVKSLIRSIEEHVKSGCSSMGHSSHSESRRSSTSSDISLASLKELVSSPLATPESPHSPSKEFAFRAASLRVSSTASASSKPPRERSPQQATTPTSCSVVSSGLSDNSFKTSVSGTVGGGTGLYSTPTRIEGGGELSSTGKVSYPISSILKDRSTPRRNSGAIEVDITKKETPSKDPLASLAKLMKGSKRNALLKWCQMKTIQYSNVDITNFSSSWNDGLAFCALLHSYVPQKIPYSELNSDDKMRNFSLAFKVGEGIGIKSNLNINDMVCMERPDWQAVMNYVTSIYKHFEVDNK